LELKKINTYITFIQALEYMHHTTKTHTCSITSYKNPYNVEKVCSKHITLEVHTNVGAKGYKSYHSYNSCFKKGPLKVLIIL
jgi:hypothetical protein